MFVSIVLHIELEGRMVDCFGYVCINFYRDIVTSIVCNDEKRVFFFDEMDVHGILHVGIQLCNKLEI